MMCFSSGLLLIRSMTIVLLGLKQQRLAIIYVMTDLGFYLITKLLRGDFWYWMPLEGIADLIFSFISRVLVKIVTDFTSIVQFRHPNEVGGASWAIGVFLTIGGLPIALILTEKEHPNEKIVSLAQSWGKYLTALVFLAFAVFFYNIERKYWHTFFSLQRGKDLTIKKFRESETDVNKAHYSFKKSRRQWVSIEDKVRKWVEENWERWEEEKPEWFTDQMKATVPVEFIPTTGEARRRESVRRASVNAEAEGGLGGALRASIRRASVESVVEGNPSRVVPIKEDN